MVYYGLSENEIRDEQEAQVYDPAKGIVCNTKTFPKMGFADNCYCGTTFKKTQDPDFSKWL